MVLRALSVYAEDRYPSILVFADALLKTLPPTHVAVPATEPARFDGFTAQPQQPQASTIIAEPTIANSAQQEGPEFDSAHTTTPVQENASEQPHVMAAVPDFGKIPETDPIVSFEPLSQIQMQPEQPALSQEDAPEDQPTAEPEDEAMPVHIDEHELETPETTSKTNGAANAVTIPYGAILCEDSLAARDHRRFDSALRQQERNRDHFSSGKAKTNTEEPVGNPSVSGQSCGIRPASADPQPDGVAMYCFPFTA